MCGLIFTYPPQIEPLERAKKVHAALARIAHRGPDGQGVISGKQWAIGHRRLSIIDLACSHQPIDDPAGRYSLTYNGEIYNYRELPHGSIEALAISDSGRH